MIPKVIHYCWFGGNTLPNDVKKCIESWKKYCPDYEIKEWNENNFDVYSHPFMKAAYEARAWAFVSDYARLKIIHDNGGIYLDTDVELLKNLDFILQNDFYIGVQQVENLCNTGLGFGANINHFIVKRMLERYDSIDFINENRKQLACPRLNTEVMKEFGYRYTDDIVHIDNSSCILSPKYLDPISPGDSKDLLCSDSISIHHYSASWESKTGKYKRKIMNIIGLKHINTIKRVLKSFKQLDF